MKGLIPVDPLEIKARGRFKIYASKLLAQLQGMKEKAVQVDFESKEKKDFESLYNALKYVVEKEDIPVSVVQRNGEIYLIKK